MFKKFIKKMLDQNVHHKHYSSSGYKKSHYKHYSSSDYKKKHYGHPSKYGHHHYKKKHKSSGFFGSFYSS